MKIFVINLPESVKRRELAEKQLNKLGLDYEIVQGINGHEITDENLYKLSDYNEVQKNPKWLTKGGIGCTLSHLKAMKIIVDSNLDKALILEDDFLFCEGVVDVLTAIERESLDDEVVLLGWLSWVDQPFLQSTVSKINDQYIIAQPEFYDYMITAHAYVITKSAAAKIININTPVRVISDSWGYYYSKGGFTSLRCILPSSVKSANFSSDLGYRRNIVRKIFKLIEERFAFVHRIAAQKREKYLSQYAKYHFV